jgi:hypothetical protein
MFFTVLLQNGPTLFLIYMDKYVALSNYIDNLKQKHAIV